jgi:hypothetical protein
LLDRLHLDDNGVFDQEIDDVHLRQAFSFVLDGQDDAAAIPNPAKLQFSTQAGVVGAFKKARTRMPMHLDRCPDGPFADGIARMHDEAHRVLPERPNMGLNPWSVSTISTRW